MKIYIQPTFAENYAFEITEGMNSFFYGGVQIPMKKHKEGRNIVIQLELNGFFEKMRSIRETESKILVPKILKK